MEDAFIPFAVKMRAEGLPEAAIAGFKHYYRKLVAGEQGLIPEAAIEPVEALPDAEDLGGETINAANAAMAETVIIKLNGGLGTSMGLQGPKSLLKVRKGLTFLDIAARQAERSGVPLVLMNSFSTRAASLSFLEKYPGAGGELPRDFLQHKVPKVLARDFSPASWPKNPELEWCPPGHGDIYLALQTSGLLDLLLRDGYRYAFVSNIDNLGAVLSTAILGSFVRDGSPFLMETADRTPVDRKGGHLARRQGRLILREVAQCPEEDMGAFQGIGRHRYFNTNNLWLHLPSLRDLLAKSGGVMDLDMIRNRKHLDPRDESSPEVYQLETAMGAAISLFEGAKAIRVPRERFAPVKKTAGLLNARSDSFLMTDDYRIIPNPARTCGDFAIDLDPRFYGLIDDMEARFPGGPPSLLHCRSLTVRGDVRFGSGIVCEGDVSVVNETGKQAVLEDGRRLEGEITLP
jgi:UTP--glucose-1-phosphate uridylyltransferase